MKLLLLPLDTYRQIAASNGKYLLRIGTGRQIIY
jgi:hypothetical protein